MKTLVHTLVALTMTLMICVMPASAQAHKLLLDDGMPLIVTPVKNISSATAKAGDPVDFSVVHRCRVDGTVLIDKGTLVHGVVTKAQHSKMFGQKGVLEVSFSMTSAIDGSPLHVRASLGKKGNQEQNTASRVARFLPYGVGLAFNGKDAILQATVPLTIFIDENATFMVVPGQVPKRIGSSPGKPGQRTAPDETAH